jgi:hypothetical protein
MSMLTSKRTMGRVSVLAVMLQTFVLPTQPSSAMTGVGQFAGVERVRADADAGSIMAQYYSVGGDDYCWCDEGWQGPGWYWCGYEWDDGLGWGGPYDWNG